MPLAQKSHPVHRYRDFDDYIDEDHDQFADNAGNCGHESNDYTGDHDDINTDTNDDDQGEMFRNKSLPQTSRCWILDLHNISEHFAF